MLLISNQLLGQLSPFMVRVGSTYTQSFPDGRHIKNYQLTNIDANISLALINKEHFKLIVCLGAASHNFGLKDISEDKFYTYFRIEEYSNLTTQFELSETNIFPIRGFYLSIRAGLYNQWCFIPSWQMGLLSKPYRKMQFFVQFNDMFYYKVPDDNYLLFDFTDNFYPLGNERWSITAGVVFKLGKKHDG